MGWKGTMRSIMATARAMEREAQRRQRELERQRKHLEKMQELEQAAYEVEVYQNYLDLLLSIHTSCGKEWDWEEIAAEAPPPKPEKADREAQAQHKLDTYKPGFYARFVKRVEHNHAKLAQAVEQARKQDEAEYQAALKQYQEDHAEWKQTTGLAKRTLAGEAEAYLEAIRQVNPFGEITGLGSSIQCSTNGGEVIEATLVVNGEDVIPAEEKTLLKSGKLSVKKLNKGRFWELYQDYVCGCVLRVTRELFALLPVDMVITTAMGNLLNTRTGHKEDQPILSVAMPRKTLEGLIFDMIDQSDSMENFVHRMNFKKTKGFSAIEAIKPEELESTR